MKNENYTPRERIDAGLLARLMEECDVPAKTSPLPTRTPGRALAMVYSPEQCFEELYDAEEGLYRGTIFRQLDKPLMVGCSREGRCRI